MHMMLQHARLFLANRSVTIETLLRLNSPQIAFVDSWAMARSTFCVQDWDLTALMSGPPTHKKKYIKIKKIKKKHEKMWKWKKMWNWGGNLSATAGLRWEATARHTRPIRSSAQKDEGRNDCLGPIMHQVHTTWGKLPSGSFQLVLVMHTCTDLFYLCWLMAYLYYNWKLILNISIFKFVIIL